MQLGCANILTTATYNWVQFPVSIPFQLQYIILKKSNFIAVIDVIALERFSGTSRQEIVSTAFEFQKAVFKTFQFHYRRIPIFEINKHILNSHRSKVKKKYFHGIHYNIYTHEISSKLNHYIDNSYLLPKFSESRRNSPICQAIKHDIPAQELLNLD